MRNFGQFKSVLTPVELPPDVIGQNDDGEFEYGPKRYVNVYFFRNEEGEDICNIAKDDPHKFYIAVDGGGVVFSMTDDIEQSQIEGADIIGIDDDFGFTFGPGGTVYGKIWNGNAIIEPPVTELVPDEISRRQFFQYLAVLGIISRQEALAALQSGAIPAPLQAIIDQLPTEDDQFEAQMFIIGAQNFNRLHPLSDTVRIALGWTVEQKDDFWREASKL